MSDGAVRLHDVSFRRLARQLLDAVAAGAINPGLRLGGWCLRRAWRMARCGGTTGPMRAAGLAAAGILGGFVAMMACTAVMVGGVAVPAAALAVVSAPLTVPFVMVRGAQRRGAAKRQRAEALRRWVERRGTADPLSRELRETRRQDREYSARLRAAAAAAVRQRVTDRGVE